MSFGYIPDYKGKSFLKDLYLRIFGYPYPPRRNEARLVFKLLEPKKNERVLALGCGEGVWYNELARRGINVVGIDISKKDIRKAKKRANAFGNAPNFIVCDAQVIPLKKNSFQKIISICVLEHISNDTKVFNELNFILKSGGRAVISVPRNEISFITKLALKMPKIIKRIFFSTIVRESSNKDEYRENLNAQFSHVRNYDLEEIIEKVESHGFIVENITYNSRLFGNFITGLIHTLKFFEWKKSKDTDYRFKNLLVYGLLFPIAYPLFLIDDLLYWKSGLHIVISIRKHDKVKA
ncbi:MAG: class I SAM-dependent methyltransferase [Thermodesulfobacteriota bacterium]